MEHVKIPWKSWVIVCDGAKALIFRNDGNAERLNLTLFESFLQSTPRTSELGSDRPGRVFQSHGAARSATEETDRHSRAETAFLSNVVEQLDKVVREHAVENVILVAPPKALAELRKQFTPALRAVVTAEVVKDLARLSTTEIEKHLSV